ncbi:FAXC-like protein [Mya arenaria]|uniref:FAXC-like protein n=1 Tax=Mya arenaria TaxID=6604 RepID=A0ABY7FAL1_MYAAR|nr:FAXC-like protein [Mya arenaria]
MESVRDFLLDNRMYFLTGAAICGSALLVYRKISSTGHKPRVCGLDYPRDLVILHSIPRDRLTPNLGHFSLKLETYLRVNAIPYQFDGQPLQGPKGKVPWIEHNGVTMGDSQFIIQYLEKEFKVERVYTMGGFR